MSATIEAPAIEVSATEVTETVWTGFEFTIDTKTLKHSIDSVSRAVSSRPSHPVLANIKIDVVEGNIKFVGFDLSLGIEVNVSAVVSKTGSITLPAKLLSDIVNKLPVGDVKFKQDQNVVTVSVGRSKFKISGIHSAEFPELPSLNDVKPVLISTESLTTLFAATGYAVSSDETKQILTGSRITIHDNKIEMAATDGHRLAVSSTQVEVEEYSELTIPGKALREVCRFLAKSEPDDLEFRFDDAQVQITGFGFKITSRLLEGQYPNYQQLIPRQFLHEIVVDTKLFVAALERSRIVADYKNNIISLEFNTDDQQILVTVDSGESSINEEIPVQVLSGGKVEVKNSKQEVIAHNNFVFAINVRYLIDSVNVFGSAEIKMQCNSATSPIVLTGFEAGSKIALLMPVKARS